MAGDAQGVGHEQRPAVAGLPAGQGLRVPVHPQLQVQWACNILIYLFMVDHFWYISFKIYQVFRMSMEAYL